MEAEHGTLYPCPTCGRVCKAHDFTDHTLRHLNFFHHYCYGRKAPLAEARLHWSLARAGKRWRKFKEHLPAHGGQAARVLKVACDMLRAANEAARSVLGAGIAFIEAATERCENASVTADWFHVAALVSKAMDEVRSGKARAAAQTPALRDPHQPRYEDERRPGTGAARAGAKHSGHGASPSLQRKPGVGAAAQGHQGAAWRMTTFVNYWLQELKAGLFEPLRRALTTNVAYQSQILRRRKSTYSNAKLKGLNGLFRGSKGPRLKEREHLQDADPPDRRAWTADRILTRQLTPKIHMIQR